MQLAKRVAAWRSSGQRLPASSAPATDEFEVSIFGPGIGEAIAVHLGGGDWITVDSCRNQRTGEHVLLDYFGDIGVDVGEAVKCVVGTHAHDDHISGIARLYEKAASATYVTSSAFTMEEFAATVALDRRLASDLRRTIYQEYLTVFAEAKRRQAEGMFRPVHFAIEQRVIFARPATERLPEALVLALSPSDESLLRAQTRLASRFPSLDGATRPLHIDPNECSVALWVQFGANAALLGADLSKGPDRCGWQAVVATHSPPSKASLYKVAHHGSPTGDLEAVWTSLLDADVLAMVAPFRGGRRPLPGDDDVERLKSRAGSLFATASSQAPAMPSAVRRNAAALTGLGATVREQAGIPGHLQARRLTDEVAWRVLANRPALQH